MTAPPMPAPDDVVAGVAEAFRRACRAELQAMKPGNVHVFAPGHRMQVADFERSAEAAAPFVARRGARVGQRVHDAMAATLSAVGQNTNLGILLLAAPLAAAARRSTPGGLRPALGAVLGGLDVADADAAFAAIRLANPGGLGGSPQHDVREPASVGLRQAMAAARGRDRIAEQYAGGYADIFDFGLPELRLALARWRDEAWATASLYLLFLARFPDSHVARKFGIDAAEALRRRAEPIAQALRSAERPTVLQTRLLAFDAELKAAGLNPGTSADLTVATLFAHRLEAGLAAP